FGDLEALGEAVVAVPVAAVTLGNATMGAVVMEHPEARIGARALAEHGRLSPHGGVALRGLPPRAVGIPFRPERSVPAAQGAEPPLGGGGVDELGRCAR